MRVREGGKGGGSHLAPGSLFRWCRLQAWEMQTWSPAEKEGFAIAGMMAEGLSEVK